MFKFLVNKIFFASFLFAIMGCRSTPPSSVEIIPESQELRSAVKSKIRDETANLTDCYKNFAPGNELNPTGKLVLRIIVSKSGQVTNVSRDEKASTFADEKISACFKKVISGITFPVNSLGKEAEIIFPFVFQGK
jgi:hypothetical protein